jgi:hypothetical protein
VQASRSCKGRCQPHHLAAAAPTAHDDQRLNVACSPSLLLLQLWRVNRHALLATLTSCCCCCCCWQQRHTQQHVWYGQRAACLQCLPNSCCAASVRQPQQGQPCLQASWQCSQRHTREWASRMQECSC